MQADLWAWISRYRTQAVMEGNSQKQRLVNLETLGWQHLRAERPDDAIVVYREGMKLAQDLNEPCWELYYEYWLSEAYLFYKLDYQTGLDLAVKHVAKAAKTIYQDCPVLSRVYFTMVQAYCMVDALGYATKIREMLAHMEENIPADNDTYLRMRFCYAELAFHEEDYATAEDLAQQYISLCQWNSYRLNDGYDMLRVVAYARGQVQDAFNYAHQATNHARTAHIEPSVGMGLLWQGVYALRLGQLERAQALIAQGLHHYEHYEIPRGGDYYDAACQYYEQSGEISKALTLREEQLADTKIAGGIAYTAHKRLQYCRFLGRTGRDIQAALQACYEVAQDLLRADLYLKKLKRVEQGQYSEYEWEDELKD